FPTRRSSDLYVPCRQKAEPQNPQPVNNESGCCWDRRHRLAGSVCDIAFLLWFNVSFAEAKKRVFNGSNTVANQRGGWQPIWIMGWPGLMAVVGFYLACIALTDLKTSKAILVETTVLLPIKLLFYNNTVRSEEH